MSKYRPLPKSFKYAWNGLKTATKNEPNFRIHLTFASTALIMAILLRFKIQEWLLLLFTISFVLILELFNTAMESIVNLVSPEIRDQAKIAKDVSAAAVLIGAMMAIIVGFVLFYPKLIAI
jgi:diacylglycerol kinase